MAESLLMEARSILTSIGTTLVERLTSDSEDAAFETLKSEIKEKISVDDDVELPDDVLDVFATTIAEKINDSSSSLTGSFTSIFTSLVETLVSAFSSTGNQRVVVDGTTYTLSFNPLKTKTISLTMGKIGTISSSVSWTDADGESHETTLTWKNLSKSTLKEYYNLIKETIEDVLSVDWSTLVSSGLTDSKSRSQLLKLVKKYLPDGVKTAALYTKYVSLSKKYAQLDTAVDKNKSVVSKAKSFIKAANKIETALGLEASNLIAATDAGVTYDFKNAIVSLDDALENAAFELANYYYAASEINASLCSDGILIVGDKKKNTIIGGLSDDSIDGGKGKDILIGFDGDDTLIGGAGDDTLFGGNGADFFVYESGDGSDLILDYNPEDGDVIKLGEGVSVEASLKNNDVILKINGSSKKLTLENASDKEITIEYADGNREICWFEPTSEAVETSELDQIVADRSIENPTADDYNMSDFKIDTGVNVIESKSIVRADVERSAGGSGARQS